MGAPCHHKWEKKEGNPVTTHACDLGNLERAQLTDFQALEHTSDLNICEDQVRGKELGACGCQAFGSSLTGRLVFCIKGGGL